MTEHPLLPADAGASDRLRSGTTAMVAGTLVAAIAAYLFQLIVGNALGPADFAPISVLWTIQFLVFTTVFMPMEQLTIRRLSAVEPKAAPWAIFGGLIATATAATVLFGHLTLDRLLAGDPWYLVILAFLILGYGGFALGRGFLAGRLRYRDYGVTTLAESVLRLVLAAALLAAGVGALGVSVTLVAGSLVIWLWSPLRGERRRDRGAEREPGSVGTLATFITANASAQTIVASGPLIVGGLGAPDREVSIFFETFLLFRAPLTVSYSLIARVLPPFTAMMERGEHGALRRRAVWIAAAGAGGTALAYAFGLTFGAGMVELLLPKFRPEAELAAIAAAGMTLATVALFEQQVLIAMRATRRLAGSWLIALLAAVLVIAFDGSEPSIRVARAFLAGEATALIALTAAILTRRMP